ncbi:MAG: peroxiredoxin [Bacteroidales bacterium]|nr:MAG: peroxiredoxin [Bacteroidales bacterium]
MKKILLLSVLVLSMTQLWSQPVEQDKTVESRNFRIPLIGEQAPSFTAESTNGVLNFPEDYGRKWKILFSHPRDFTPVCSSELLELADLQKEFDKLGVKLAVISTDPLSTHVQWKKALEEISIKDREKTAIKFPLVDDEKLVISKQYGMIHSATNSTIAVRGVFIIDPKDVIQAIYFYPMSVGRNTDELVRMVTALQLTYAENVMTPANWKSGNDFMIPYSPESITSKSKEVPSEFYNLSWFMWFKKAN